MSLLTPEVFAQKVPCQDCPFRKVGGVRHTLRMMLRYISYFVVYPGATFPCHKSVPKSDDRSKWSEWQDGQVLCAGGLLFAAKQGARNWVTEYAIAHGWYDPRQHKPEELALVFDTPDDMLLASAEQIRVDMADRR